MDHAVRRRDVGLHDVAAVDGGPGVGHLDVHVLALHGGDGLLRLEICGHHLRPEHVVREDVRQLVLVGEDGVQLVGRHLGERVVGRREHRERAFALQRLHEIRRLHRGDERAEVRIGARHIDDGLRLHRLVRRLLRALARAGRRGGTGVVVAAAARGHGYGDECRHRDGAERSGDLHGALPFVPTGVRPSDRGQLVYGAVPTADDERSRRDAGATRVGAPGRAPAARRERGTA